MNQCGLRWMLLGRSFNIQSISALNRDACETLFDRFGLAKLERSMQYYAEADLLLKRSRNCSISTILHSPFVCVYSTISRTQFKAVLSIKSVLVSLTPESQRSLAWILDYECIYRDVCSADTCQRQRPPGISYFSP